MTRLLVTGAGGMLGQDLLAVLATRADLTVTATTRAELDITDPHAVQAAVTGHDLVINTAAWTDVDAAETREDLATAVNGHAVANLAQACAQTGARLIHISTDYVFPGNANTPYAEDAPTDPANAYGRSKLAGEQAVARFLPDTYHGTCCSGRTTWYGLARAVFTLAGLDPERIWPTTSDRFPRPAHRPAYSVLGHARWTAAGLTPLPDWHETLSDAFGSPTPPASWEVA